METELATDDPPAFLAFLLALSAGLRRIEIDRLGWAAFRFRDNVIRIEPTRYFDVKTEHSIGDVQVDPELMAVFRGYFARAGSNFVIEGAGPPIPEASWEHYRAQAVFERLSAWLRGHGVTARKPRIKKRVRLNGEPQTPALRRQGFAPARRYRDYRRLLH